MAAQSTTTVATGNIDNVSAEAAIVDEAMLAGKVHEIRGQKVMLDTDLAEIYGYDHKAFNRQVANNADRFDSDFRFQLTREEVDNLRSNNCTANISSMSRSLPYAFTEQGVYMLMTVLRGDLAIRQSKTLIRLFKRMKDHVVENQALIGQRDFLRLSMQVSGNIAETLELRHELSDVENEVAAIVSELGDVVHASEIGSVMEQFGETAERYGFLLLDGRPIEAAAAYASVYRLASETLFVVDNYVGRRTLALFAEARPGVSIKLFTDNRGRKLRAEDMDAFHDEYPSIDLEIRSAGGFVHDRYIVIDYDTAHEAVFHCGGSSKDAGMRMTSIIREGHPELYHQLVDRLLEQPKLEMA